jgi:GGDEF domain-containing protein
VDLDRTKQGLRYANERLEHLASQPIESAWSTTGSVLGVPAGLGKGSTLCALLADLYDVKRINDRLCLAVGNMALVQIARQLIETSSDLDMLKTFCVKYAQGFLLGRPV